MSADKLLARLDKVKATGPGRWQALCPAHDDRNPSLSVRETDDGTLLVKCWSGCGAADVVAAVGLEMKDLFPESTRQKAPLRPGERWVPRDVLRAVATEALIVVIAGRQLQQGKPLAQEDSDRLSLAVSRLQAAAEGVGV